MEYNMRNIYKYNIDLFQALSFIILTSCFFYLVYFMNLRIDTLINSDDSAELILGKLLSKEGHVLSKDWYYSTEIRVFSCQLIYKILFYFTDDWHLVRIISNVVIYLFFLASYYFLCESMECKEYYLITSVLLILPLSTIYFNHILKMPLYIPYVSISFISMGLLFNYIRSNKSIYIILCIFIAFIAGLGGVRQPVVTYIPLFIAAILLNIKNNDDDFFDRNTIKFKCFLFSFFALLFSVIGFIVNSKILRNYYTFDNWNLIKFTKFSSNFESVANLFMNCFGYSHEKIFSIYIYQNIVSFLFISFSVVAVIIYLKSKIKSFQYNIISLIYVVSVAVFWFIYSFTDIRTDCRCINNIGNHVLPMAMISIPLLACFLKYVAIKNNLKKYAITIFVLFVVFSSTVKYVELYYSDETKDLRKISEILNKNEIYTGCSTFWNSCVLTELSNGNIDVYSFDSMDDITDIKKIYKWLQLKKHTDIEPSGKIFLLFNTREFEKFKFLKNIDDDDLLMVSQKYVLLWFESYKKMLSRLAIN